MTTKTIKVHFSRNIKHFNYFSRLLQWYEGLPISHILVELDSANLGTEMICHSSVGNGVSIITKPRFETSNEIMETYDIEMSIQDYRLVRNSLLSYCGENYGLMQNIGIYIVDKLRRLGIKKENPYREGQNCSELIYRSFISIQYPNAIKIDPDLVKPSQIRRILKGQGLIPVMSKIDT